MKIQPLKLMHKHGSTHVLTEFNSPTQEVLDITEAQPPVRGCLSAMSSVRHVQRKFLKYPSNIDMTTNIDLESLMFGYYYCLQQCVGAKYS